MRKRPGARRPDGGCSRGHFAWGHSPRGSAACPGSHDRPVAKRGGNLGASPRGALGGGPPLAWASVVSGGGKLGVAAPPALCQGYPLPRSGGKTTSKHVCFPPAQKPGPRAAAWERPAFSTQSRAAGLRRPSVPPACISLLLCTGRRQTPSRVLRAFTALRSQQTFLNSSDQSLANGELTGLTGFFNAPFQKLYRFVFRSPAEYQLMQKAEIKRQPQASSFSCHPLFLPLPCISSRPLFPYS